MYPMHWNSLPEPAVSAPSLATFKHTLTMYYMHWVTLLSCM